MPEAGEYLFSHVGFSKDEKPVLSLQKDEKIIPFQPLGVTFTLTFDMSARFCTGWYDMRSSESHPCPESAVSGEKYEQCSACQKRTGFNPAFYHATSVSPQQEERNLQPHFLYLAYFGAATVKVGISHAARGNSRLLEQGARSALILETFPTAHIARQYEAKIAALPGISETVQLRKKIAELARTYDREAAKTMLLETRARIETSLGTTFAKNHALPFDPVFFPAGVPDLAHAHDLTSQNLISGHAIGMLGPLLFCESQDTVAYLPLKKYVGHNATLSFKKTELALPAQQTSLF